MWTQTQATQALNIGNYWTVLYRRFSLPNPSVILNQVCCWGERTVTRRDKAKQTGGSFKVLAGLVLTVLLAFLGVNSFADFFGNGPFGHGHPINSFYQTGNDEAICLDDSSGRIALLAAGAFFIGCDLVYPLPYQ